MTSFLIALGLALLIFGKLIQPKPAGPRKGGYYTHHHHHRRRH